MKTAASGKKRRSKKLTKVEIAILAGGALIALCMVCSGGALILNTLGVFGSSTPTPMFLIDQPLVTMAATLTNTIPPPPASTVAPLPSATPYPTFTPVPALPTLEQPTANQPGANQPGADQPAGTSGKCVDGTYTSAQHKQGACSHHGGVAVWWGP